MSIFCPSNLTMKRRIEEQKVYISKKLAEYFSVILLHGKLDFLPNQSSFVSISNIKRLGGVSNDVYSFLLTTQSEEHKQQNNLVLKTYGKTLDPVLRAYVNDEVLKRCVKEFQVLRSLERVGFPAPKAYIYERDSSILGYPFIIMQKEEPTQKTIVKIDNFAKNLARLHNLDVEKLGIDALKVPDNEYEFARGQILYLKRFLNLSPNHGKGLKEDFELAIHWLETNISKNRCRKYCLLHGD